MPNEILDTIADAVNPGLAALALIFPWLNRGAFRNKGAAWYFWLRTLMSLVIVYVILFADNRFDLWPRLGLDYSTHTAFAVAIITSLTVVSRRWLLLLIPILVGYAALMMYLGYHSLEDILTAALIIGPITWGIHQISRAGRPAGANGPQNWKRNSP